MERARRSGTKQMMREARAMPSRLSREEASDLALRRERLVDTEGSGERPQEGPSFVPGRTYADYYYDLEQGDDWEAWRNDYEERSG